MLHPFSVTRPLLLPVLAAAIVLTAHAGQSVPPTQLPSKDKRPAAAAKSPKQQQTRETKGVAKQKPAAQPPLPPKTRIAGPLPPRAKPGDQNFLNPRQIEGDGPGGKAQAPGPQLRPNIARPEDLLARVPKSGPLTVDHLIMLAVANDPQLAIRRGQIVGAGAAKESARDLPNPEVRLSYSSEDKDQLELPYTETVRRSVPAFPSSSYQEIERMVTPGRDYDSYTINSYDVFNDGVNPTSRTLIGTTHEQRATTEVNDGGEQTGAMIRFSLPNPWERKARIQRAVAEIGLSEAQYLSDEDQLVREVRDLYESLSGYGSELGVHEKRIANYRGMRAEMEGSGVPSFAFEAARARGEMTGIQNDMREVQRDYDKTRIAIAKLCGLRDYTRIRSNGMVARRILDPGALDETYLLDLAMIHRAVAVEAAARRDIAVARLAESKASGKLVATFIDVGWNGSDDNGRSGRDDEWFARLGISIPVWDYAKINKSSRAYAAYAHEMERALEIQREHISVEISLAIQELRMASGKARQADGDVNEARREANSIEASLKAATLDINDIGKVQRTKYDSEDNIQQTNIGRIAAWSDYNKALRRLEDAIGTRIEKALAR